MDNCYKLVVSDLDGTLLDKNMKISNENALAIARLADLGVNFAISSGRTLCEILEPGILDGLNVRYVAYSNGAAIYDTEKGEKVASFEIKPDEIAVLFDVLDDYDASCAVHVDGYSYFDAKMTTEEAFSKHRINDYYRKIILNMRMRESVECLAREASAVESVVAFFASDDEREAAYERLDRLGCFAISSSVERSIEINSARAGKGVSLLEIAELFGACARDTIALGDNLNDVPMFDAAGLSLCVKNGNQGAKQSADHVVCSSDEHVARYILDNIILRK